MSERNSARACHTFLIVLLFFLAPIHFIHLFPHFSTHLVGDAMDSAQYPWNIWWTAHALLDLKTNPFHTNHMFYPLGLSLTQQTYTFLDGLLYTVSRPLVPLLAFHNFLTWLSIFLNSLAAYILIFRMTGLSGLAFIAALAFGHSPVLTSYQGSQCLIEPYLFVFFVTVSFHLFEVRRTTWGVAAGIFLGLSVYNYPYFFVFGLVWLMVLVLYSLFPWSVKSIETHGIPRGLRPGMVIPWLIFSLFFFLALISKETWEKAGISLWFRTPAFLGFLAMTYFLLKFGNIVYARWKRTAIIPRGSSVEHVDDRDLPGWLKRLWPQWLEWRPPKGKETAGILILCVVVLAAALLAAFPYTLSYLTDPGTRSAVKSLPIDFETFSVDLAGFFAPLHPWLTGISERIVTDWSRGRPLGGTYGFFGYLWMVLVVVGIGLFIKKEALRVWILAWLVFLFCCLGPYLKFHGLVYTDFILPGYMLPSLPLLGSTRTLSRFLVPLTLFSLVIGCLLLKEHLRKLSVRTRMLWYAGLALATVFETALIPFPLQTGFTDYRIPPVYQALAEEARGREGVLLDLPLFMQAGDHWEGRRETRTFFYQTVHRQWNVGGVSSKLDARVFDFFRKVPGVEAFWNQKPITRRTLEDFLAVIPVDWIIIEKSRYERSNLDTYLTAISQTPRAKIFFEDIQFVGYQIQRETGTHYGVYLHPGF